MKFTLVFLCALMVISRQQLQHPQGVNWLTPYYLAPQPVINSYQPQYYKDVDDETQFFRNLRIAYPQYQHNVDENDYVDPQSRFKGFYQPFLPQNPRFFFGGGIVNPFMKIATFTVTSTLNVTRTEVCIPVAQFVAGSTNACRRKKRQILDSLDNASDSEHTQFSLTPSKTQQVMPSATASLLPGNHEFLESRTERRDHRIISSKDEVVLDDLSSLSKSQSKNMRERRLFFNNQILTTTVTQYSVYSTTTVRPVSAVLASAGQLSCLPPGAILCPPAAG